MRGCREQTVTGSTRDESFDRGIDGGGASPLRRRHEAGFSGRADVSFHGASAFQRGSDAGRSGTTAERVERALKRP
jgi:hypothetical protein